MSVTDGDTRRGNWHTSFNRGWNFVWHESTCLAATPAWSMSSKLGRRVNNIQTRPDHTSKRPKFVASLLLQSTCASSLDFRMVLNTSTA